MKKVETDGDIYHDCALEESILSKWLYYSKQSTDSMQSPSNYQIFTELEQKILEFLWRHKWPQIAEAILKKRNRVGGIRLPDFRLYLLQSYSHQISMPWHKNRNTDQWDRIENPEINPRNHSQLTYNKGDNTTQCGKDSLLNKWCWWNWIATCRKMKLDHSLTPHTKINPNRLRT